MPPPRIISCLPIQSLPRTRLRRAITVLPRRYASNEPLPNPVPPIPTYSKSVAIQTWPQEPLIPPPKKFDVLTERKPNRSLPPPESGIPREILWSFPLFLLIMTVSSLVLFNYQRQNSSVVSSTLYALRINPLVRDLLGDEIYFESKFPWISGEINQVHGRIDITYRVKGTKAAGECRFKAKRRKSGEYDTLNWSLTLEDGRVLELYESGVGPLAGTRFEEASDVEV